MYYNTDLSVIAADVPITLRQSQIILNTFGRNFIGRNFNKKG